MRQRVFDRVVARYVFNLTRKIYFIKVPSNQIVIESLFITISYHLLTIRVINQIIIIQICDYNVILPEFELRQKSISVWSKGQNCSTKKYYFLILNSAFSRVIWLYTYVHIWIFPLSWLRLIKREKHGSETWSVVYC